LVNAFITYLSLTEGVASCPALNETLAQFKPSIETGCALLGVTNSSTNGTTNSTDGKASMGFSVQGSFVSVLALALLL
jgi:Na+-translocating ferredoxin:NAD+ oxidoreductase RnfA subunit